MGKKTFDTSTDSFNDCGMVTLKSQRLGLSGRELTSVSKREAGS